MPLGGWPVCGRTALALAGAGAGAAEPGRSDRAGGGPEREAAPAALNPRGS